MGRLILTAAPRYWGDWKGLVLKAIAIDGARTWQEIHGSTGLDSRDLNATLKELFSLDILSKSGDKYWIENYELYKEYAKYGSQITESSPDKTKRSITLTPEIREKLDNFSRYCKGNPQISKVPVMQPVLITALQNELDFNNCSEHLFLEGDSLDRLSKDIISSGEKAVVVVNPYVDKCSLSDKLKDACAAGREVVLVTRSPDLERAGKGREQKRAYHRALMQSGVQVYYNDYVHAKLLVVDGLVALVSSMNFIVSSSGGRSWEAGMVTWEEGAVNSTAEAIQKILDAPETKIGRN